MFHYGDGVTINLTESPIIPAEGKLTVGVFKHRTDGKTLALVTNRDYRKPTRTKFSIQPAGASVERFDPKTKQWSTAETEAAMNLPAGDGILLRW